MSVTVTSARTRRAARSRMFSPDVDPRVVERAVEKGQLLAQRLGGRQLQLRKAFVRRAGADAALPPAARLDRASPTYLKFFVTLVWASAGRGLDVRDLPRTSSMVERVDQRRRQEAAGWPASRLRLLPSDPHTTTFALVDYAVLVGLDKPKTAGTAAIRRGIQHLESEGLIRAERRQGTVPTLQLLREDGTGKPYSLPADKRSSPTGAAEGRYVTLPPTLWTNGWIAALSGRALLVLVSLLVQRDIDPDTLTFVAPSIRESLYGIGEDTFSRGASELKYYGLVARTVAPARRTWSASGNHVRHQFLLTHETGLAKLPTDHL